MIVENTQRPVELKVAQINDESMDKIHSIILDGLMAIKWQVHKSLGVSHYPMDKFFEHNIDCLHALLYKRLEEIK